MTETYYALILLDGDRMGAWLSGTEAGYNLPYATTWHPKIRAGVQGKFPQLDAYLNADRAVSSARHMAISSALNVFAPHMARHVVEDLCKGKLLYAGGDDVLAMVSVDDLLACLFLLRLAAIPAVGPIGRAWPNCWASSANATWPDSSAAMPCLMASCCG